MRNISSFFIILSCISLSAQVKDDTIAKVNGEAIYLSEIEKMKENLKQQYLEFGAQMPSSNDIFSIALDKIIEEKLLMQEAEKEKIKTFDWEVKQEIDNLKRRIAISEGMSDLSNQKIDFIFNEKLRNQNITMDELKNNIKKKIMMEKLVEQKIKSKLKNPTEEEVKRLFDDIIKIMKSTYSINSSPQDDKEFYFMISERFKEVFGERVRYRHIVIKPLSYNDADRKVATQKAESIRKRILSGEDFEEIAVKESADLQSAKNGGDMGYVFRGSLPENLEKVVFSLNPGEISDPVWTDFGCHIIQVTEKKIAEKPKFELVKKDLENILLQRKFAEAIDNYVKELKKKASIEIYKK